MDMGLIKAEALSTVRISFGKIHSIENVKTVANTIHQILIQQKEVFIAHAG
jgi:cysteine sulfinate desulfinase/cysteine desulfurase-like protein